MGLPAESNRQTELEEAREALQVSERQLAFCLESLRKTEAQALAGRLALEVMHEVKNPLEALGHLTYLALQEADDAAKVRGYLLQAEEQMQIVSQIAKQTLSFSQQVEKPRAIGFVALAEAAIRIHQRAMAEKRIHLVRDLPEDIVAEVFTGEMLQVFSNLIVNALDALPADGTLHLRIRKRQNEVHFTIADNGHGIAKSHADAIFQPFFTTKADRGTGLGLALSKRIIAHHNGRICVRSSVMPGRSGTTFRISLPLRTAT
jgi:signal transduction histidine kinase